MQTTLEEVTDKSSRLISGDTLPGVSILQGQARLWMGLALILADLGSWIIAGLLAVGMRLVFPIPFHPHLFFQVIPVMLICMGIYGLQGLYPGIGFSRPDELRRLTTITTFVCLSLAASTFWARNPEEYSRLTLTLAWVFALGLIPLGRGFTRWVMGRQGLWGEPAAVIGFGKQGKWVLDFLQRNPSFGLRPVVVINGFDPVQRVPGSLPIIHLNGEDGKQNLPDLPGIKTAVLIVSEVPQNFLSDIVDNQQSSFRRLIMIPNLQQISSFGATTNDLGGILGLDVRCNLLNPWERALKRVLDIVMVLVIGILISPLLFLLGTLVKLDSKGSVFYGHTRIGKNRRKFKAWKFQTMVSDADQVLDAYLAQNPGLRAEWETTHKLKNDPRVTRLGSILRKFSLDELPQLWNVLRCEMSLVGPRPIVEDEVKHYATRFKLYTRVLPGITGMWQVSGRNDTTYEERVRLDEYYVRNWSIWLDIYILIRTIWVVMGRDGAY